MVMTFRSGTSWLLAAGHCELLAPLMIVPFGQNSKGYVMWYRIRLSVLMNASVDMWMIYRIYDFVFFILFIL